MLTVYLPAPASTTLAILMILFGPLMAFFLLWKAIGLKGYASIFAYSSGKSYLYRIDPRVKLLYAVAVPALASTFGIYVGVALLAFTLFLYGFMNNPLKDLRFIVLLMLSIILPSAWIDSITFSGFRRLPSSLLITIEPASMGIRGVSMLGLLFGLASSVPAALAVAAAFIIVFTSSPSDLLTSMVKSKVPYELAFAMTLALVSIPKVLDSFSSLTEVLRSRGFLGTFNFQPIKTLFQRFWTYLFSSGLIVADFVIDVLRSSQNIAVSADIRGFRASKKRTYYRDFRMKSVDWALSFVLLIAFVIAILR
ncbi:MAG: energy-coupling factor transporter transmembrane protein EcfT [Nitrososphaerota archaeon]|nr:energy-coupling factor transporter transmembrane protein EcfT [Nitrososphaerota archaeon]MDG6927968.1 energy-coupling factor transporter transmembrane protein EcfT [Nitrososphaerota archaeon]MDG6929637.1 energy-coupling factor transporter transmembrane protein EcfT [Nitrososphaerota archaeon]MDG6932854.1 energy-coupling factor transporter transmembrane protein EcfT [Nitrososphaerota archaeon]MDG6936823.1 energy-coupling factor transporter transmembrane protein EcfT [Nitrososphaerota archaeon